MKKVFLVFAGMVLAGAVIAQTATINQTSNGVTGTDQDATVTQTGNSSVNISQEASKVDKPSNVDGYFINQATAVQNGNGNKIVVKQVAVDAINENNSNRTNTTSATQSGNNNTLNQTQKSIDWVSGDMTFDATQIGKRNVGTQTSDKAHLSYELYQKGDDNTATQKTVGKGTGNIEAMIKQIGDDNTASQTFSGQNVRSTGATIEQYGTDGDAVQTFTNGGGDIYAGTQYRSSADILQTNASLREYAYQSQKGEGAYQYIKQSGTDNEAKMWSEGDFNEAYAWQSGKDGKITIKQYTDDDDAGAGNLAKAKQTGNNNTATLTQDGKGNAVDVIQNGKDGVIVASQVGDDNTIMLKQNSGAGSKATIAQDGENNIVAGLGGASTYAINNNGAVLKVSQAGHDNEVFSYQNVAATATVAQTGAYNTSTVNQY